MPCLFAAMFVYRVGLPGEVPSSVLTATMSSGLSSAAHTHFGGIFWTYQRSRRANAGGKLGGLDDALNVHHVVRITSAPVSLALRYRDPLRASPGSTPHRTAP